MVLAAVPEDRNTLIHEIRLIPDINNDTLQHIILPHILDNVRQVFVPGRPVTIISWVRRRSVLRAVRPPEIVDQEDESAVVKAGGAVVVKDGLEPVLLAFVSISGLSRHLFR